MSELRERRASFSGAQSLMRVRTRTEGKTESFQAKLEVGRGETMRLTVYTPIGTTAATITATGDRIATRDARGRAWEGPASEFAGSYGIFGSAIPPADLARLLLGLPVDGAIDYEATPSGLRSARAGELSLLFDPPVFPPSRVTVRHRDQVAEVEHLEIMAR